MVGRRCLRAALAVVLTAEASSAQSAVDLYQFEPPTAADGRFYLESTTTPEAGSYDVGAVGSYAYRLVTLESSAGELLGVPLKHRLSVDYLARLGLTDRLAIGFALPTVLYQRGDDLSDLGLAVPTRTALGDARFMVKGTLLQPEPMAGLGLAALGHLSVPTGDGDAYVGNEAVGAQARLLGELRLLALTLLATGGVHFRGKEGQFAGERYGHSARWGLGVDLRPQVLGIDSQGRWTFSSEVRGSVGLGSTEPNYTLAGLSARYQSEDLFLRLGAEMPVDTGVGTPLVRAMLAVGWAPRIDDEDSDGIPDEKDDCIDLEEDLDQFEDADGCPDFDNDNDGVPDEEDRCPLEKEDEDGYQDNDGCVDPDNDRDGIADAEDRCPNQPGPKAEVAERNGCPRQDSDRDGLFDRHDRCPNQAEDFDDFQDDDGCPDPDNDADGIEDSEDDCPGEPGVATSAEGGNGCPSPDTDGDTFEDDHDSCPNEAEDFDTVADDDGCPEDEEGAPLFTSERIGSREVILWAQPPRFTADGDDIDLDPSGTASWRAVAQYLNAHPEAVAWVSVRPPSESEADHEWAVKASFAAVHALRQLTYRDNAAELVSWQAIPEAALKQQQIGIVLVPEGTSGTTDDP